MLMQGAPAESPAQGRIGQVTMPWSVFSSAWKHRRLILRLARREVEARYKGSALGILWMILLPLLMLGVYTFVFNFVFKSQFTSPTGKTIPFFLAAYAGIILLNLFNESVGRSPGMMLGNVTYIKKVVFPLEILPYVTVAGELVTVVSSATLLGIFYWFTLGKPPHTAVWTPVIVAPLFLMTLGWVWFISSLGVYLRDLRHVVVVVLNLIPFLSPVFYQLKNINGSVRDFLYLSPLTVILEQLRNVLFWGIEPNWWAWGAYFVISWLVAWGALTWFRHAQTGFADVV
jgi:lipopolysaccharide transport system permease protein